MAKTDNLRVNFSKVLENKYGLTKEGINEYWDNKAKEEQYDSKKIMGIVVGASEIVGANAFLFWDLNNGSDCLIPIVVATGIGVLTAGISLVKRNPYSLEKYESIDDDYEDEKANAKAASKNTKKKTKRRNRRR